MNTTTDKSATDHKIDCPQRGFRYAATIRRTKETIANGKAGHVVMICKTLGCPAKLVI